MICTLGAIIWREREGNLAHTFKIDASGHKVYATIETEPADPYTQGPAYICTNCGKSRAVSPENFEIIRKHLGKMNGIIDPFLIKK